ncbi:hypothetical protein FKM82_023903 [Ascaphus truei]
MQNPRVLAALQERLENVSPSPSSYIETLPKAARPRINALKQLQEKSARIEAQSYEEVHELERKYAALYQPLFDKRHVIVSGEVEPANAESEWHSDADDEDKLSGDGKYKATAAKKEAADEDNSKGTPDFWLNIFRNKKQKHKGRDTVGTITKQVPNESFFNFFSPVKVSGDGEELDEDTEYCLAADFELGHLFRERIVPRAVLYFTGEAIEDEDSFEEGEEIEGEEEGEEDDDDYQSNPKE